MNLTGDNVEAVVRDCLYNDDEDHSDAVIADGIIATFGFHPGRLAAHRDDIRTMLAELPVEFEQGYSFLAACNNRQGEQWTGLHKRMAELFALGQAAGFVTCCAPREFWGMFPGGMPYYQVKLEG